MNFKTRIQRNPRVEISTNFKTEISFRELIRRFINPGQYFSKTSELFFPKLKIWILYHNDQNQTQTQ